jgi:hypothetical protein
MAITAHGQDCRYEVPRGQSPKGARMERVQITGLYLEIWSILNGCEEKAVQS